VRAGRGPGRDDAANADVLICDAADSRRMRGSELLRGQLVNLLQA